MITKDNTSGRFVKIPKTLPSTAQDSTFREEIQKVKKDSRKWMNISYKQQKNTPFTPGFCFALDASEILRFFRLILKGEGCIVTAWLATPKVLGTGRLVDSMQETENALKHMFDEEISRVRKEPALLFFTHPVLFLFMHLFNHLIIFNDYDLIFNYKAIHHVRCMSRLLIRELIVGSDVTNYCSA